jgi:transcriptional regulator NrdR family protein
MWCPKCSSPNIGSRQKYKPGQQSKSGYGTANLDRRRCVCLKCESTFYTVELIEEDFLAAVDLTKLQPQSKARIR